MIDAKPFWTSKTFWLNTVSLVIALLTAASETDLVREHPEAILWIAAAVALGNVLLRFVTSKAVTFGTWILAAVFCWSSTLEAG